MPDPLLSVKSLEAWYGESHVLHGVDLEVRAGELVTVVGRNGAGKTTLAKLLCRLYDPDGGAIEIDGIDLRDLDLTEWCTRVAAMFVRTRSMGASSRKAEARWITTCGRKARSARVSGARALRSIEA